MALERMAGRLRDLRFLMNELRENPSVSNEAGLRRLESEIDWVLGELRSMQDELGDRTEDLVRTDRQLSVARDALDSSASAVLITDREGVIVYVNPAFVRMFEYQSRADVLGLPAAKLFVADKIRSLADVEASIEEGEGKTEKFVVRRKDGLRVEVEVSTSVVADRKGLPVGRMASFVDVTERERLSTAVKLAGEAMLVTDEEGKILYANPACLEVTGYTPTEMTGRIMQALDRERNQPEKVAEIHRALDESGVWRGRLINQKKDGTSYQEDYTISAIKDAEGEVINYVAVKRDVTEMLRLESLAEAVNVADNIGYVFSGIRHEIGNPVNAIRMTLTMLGSRLDKAGDKASSEYITRCLEEISRVQYLLDNLKSFNLFENPSMREVDLGGFFKKLGALMRPDLDGKGVSLDVSVDPIAATCHADPRVLQQVLLNVVTNAAEACEQSDEPRVTVDIFAKDADRVCIRVADNGDGMSEEQTRNLFRPFYTTKPKGTGLGLVIARRMLSKMGGEIDIESSKGEGTSVCIILPAG